MRSRHHGDAMDIELHSTSSNAGTNTNDTSSCNGQEVGRTLVSNGSNNRLRAQDTGVLLSSGKGDSKVLEWSSFPPEVIRDYYLRKRRNQQQQHQQQQQQQQHQYQC